MPEFLTLLPPDQAREMLLAHLPTRIADSESTDLTHALNRVLAEDVRAPHPLPEFPRSTVDGYAVRAKDTFGASESLPAYLRLVGEVPMGAAAEISLGVGECALIHTGGMLPLGADAAVMLEYTQQISGANEIEIFKSVADGENLIRIGEDVAEGQIVLLKGTRLQPAEIGGLSALGNNVFRVASKAKIGLISTGDEIISPELRPAPGQVRDINTYTLSALIESTGGEAVRYGIIPDQFEALKSAAARALSECDAVIITAGSSASTRDMTADVIRQLGEPGVLAHGINTRPGKPTILGVCNGKAVIGLPGNPVSALVNGYLFVVPVLEKLLGATPKPRGTIRAKITVNIPSQAGREDWQAVKLSKEKGEWLATPLFGKSNLIFMLVAADGLMGIPPDVTGVAAGEMVDVVLI